MGLGSTELHKCLSYMLYIKVCSQNNKISWVSAMGNAFLQKAAFLSAELFYIQ